MKITLIETPATFQPVKLQIVIETPSELCELWHRLNISINDVNACSGTLVYECSKDNEEAIAELWNTLDTLVNKNNLVFKNKKNRKG